MNNKKTQEMNRSELVHELAGHASPVWYHSLLDWETHQLRALLHFYRGEVKKLPDGLGEVYKTKGVGGERPIHRLNIRIVVVHAQRKKSFFKRLIG